LILAFDNEEGEQTTACMDVFKAFVFICQFLPKVSHFRSGIATKTTPLNALARGEEKQDREGKTAKSASATAQKG